MCSAGRCAEGEISPRQDDFCDKERPAMPRLRALLTIGVVWCNEYKKIRKEALAAHGVSVDE